MHNETSHSTNRSPILLSRDAFLLVTVLVCCPWHAWHAAGNTRRSSRHCTKWVPSPFITGWYCLLVLALLVAQLLATSLVVSQVLPLHMYDTNDGLISNTTTSLFQESRGFLWITTYDGVSVYDGTTFRNYTTADGLAHHLTWCVAESRLHPGTIFIGTDGGGISRFQNGSFHTIRLGSGRNINRVVGIVEDAEGCLWCTTHDGVYMVVHEDSIVKLQLNEGLANLSPVVQTPDGVVWVAMSKKIHLYNQHRENIGTITVPSAQGASIEAVTVDSDGDVWVSSSDSTLFQYHGTTLLRQRHLQQGTPGGAIVDHQGMLWVGADRGSVLKIPKSQLSNGRFQHVTTPLGLEVAFAPVFVDREDNIWFAGWARGIAKLGDRSVVRFPIRLESGKFGGVDAHGHFWSASTTHILEFWNDSLGWHSFNHELKVQPGTVTMDRSGRLWLCCFDGSIRSYTIVHRFQQPSQLVLERKLLAGIHFPRGQPFMSLIDSKGYLWFSMDYHDALGVDQCIVGVIDIRNGTQLVKVFKSPDDIGLHSIRTIFEDRHGNLWFGGYTEGLAFLLAGDWHHPNMKQLTIADNLPDNGIRSMIEDDEGKLWIGTRYGGIAIYDGHTFSTLRSKDGLLSDAVWSLAKGNNGMIWAATSLGLMQIDSKYPYHMRCINELAGLTTWTCIADTAGRVLAMTSAGAMIHSSSEDLRNTVPPPVYISQMMMNGEPLGVRAGMELSHEENNIVIDFVGISFGNEKGVRYRHRLIGADRDWSMPSPSRSISYAALNPGEYTFEVLAYNADGTSSASPAVASFAILPPYWQRWWFRTIFLVALLASVGGTIRYVEIRKLRRRIERLEQEQAILQERDRTRDRIASDLHDDVASTLGSIALYSESLHRGLRNPSQPTRDLMQRISTLLNEAQDAVSDIVWSVTPRHDTLEELLWRMNDLASDLCSANKVAYSGDLPRNQGETLLPEKLRKNIYLIFKEALNNIVKHAQAMSVSLRVGITSGVLEMVIEDDGVGFPMDAQRQASSRVAETNDHPTRGHGLRNMTKRAEEIGAELSIQSCPGKGTSLHLSVRMT